MKRLIIFLLLALATSPAAMAQQDPDDPGIQDSIILGSTYMDSGGTWVGLPLYVVTDDSVAFYNLPLTWNAPSGGILPRSPNNYFPPLTEWDVTFDTLIISQNLIRQIGFAEIDTGHHNSLLNTNARMVQIMTLHFDILEYHRQIITIDTTYDDRNGPLLLGLNDGLNEITPAFVRGYIGIHVGIDGNDSELPTEFSLSQNYPNPFNAQTVISYSLPTASDVTIDIFDIPGRKIETFTNGMMPAGKHKVIWDATGQSSGIYFYRIKAEDKTEIRKMVLIK